MPKSFFHAGSSPPNPTFSTLSGCRRNECTGMFESLHMRYSFDTTGMFELPDGNDSVDEECRRSCDATSRTGDRAPAFRAPIYIYLWRYCLGF